MMTPQDILKLLDPKNQNLPGIELENNAKKYKRVNVLEFEEEEEEAEKLGPKTNGKHTNSFMLSRCG